MQGEDYSIAGMSAAETIGAARTTANDPPGAPALRATHVEKRFGARQALRDVSLDVPPSTGFALVGANGAGKTTFLKCILDLCAPDAGRIEIFGATSARPEARRRLAYLPERFTPPHYLLGREFIQMTLALAGERYDAAQAEALAGELELDAGALARPVRQLSKGMTQKLGLAACLLQPRDLYILDEPMSGLDPAARVAVKGVLQRLLGQGRGLFFTSHVLSDVEELCASMAVLERGSLRFSGATAALGQRYGGDNLEHAFLNCIRADAAPHERPALRA
jgi:ABC-type multidrug transport system ATPase subunit